MKIKIDYISLVKKIKETIKNDIKISVNKVVLFGSRLSDHYNDYSDYDILIILDNNFDFRIENQIYDSLYNIMLKYDLILDIKIISKKELSMDRGKQPFILNALKSKIFV